MTLVGVIVVLTGRVVTAGVIGANIGSGLMIQFGTPAVVVLVTGSIVRSIHILHTTSPAPN